MQTNLCITHTVSLLMNTSLTIGLAQVAPVWLNRAATIDKMLAYVTDAADQHCDLVVFGEALLPGYPFWVELTNGASFNSTVQKELYAYYAYQAVSVSSGDLCRTGRRPGWA